MTWQRKTFRARTVAWHSENYVIVDVINGWKLFHRDTKQGLGPYSSADIAKRAAVAAEELIHHQLEEIS